MSRRQQPGGVAGTLIDEVRVRYQAAETSSEAQSYGNQIAGLVVLHDELSRKARAILTELETHRERQEHPDFYAVASDLLRNTRAFFIRLGLDLESEDGE